MSSAAPAVAAGGGAPSSADDRVYRAVASGRSVDEVRRAIDSSQSAAAAVNQAGADGETPLQAARRLVRRDLICLLLQNGAEGAGDDDRFWAVVWCVRDKDLATLRRLLERGVSVNTIFGNGYTPLMRACNFSRRSCNCRDLTLEIFRRSSAETRRAVTERGYSALDYLIGNFAGHRAQIRPWQIELAGELLSSGATVLPHHTPRAMPIVAAHAARREAELAACLSMAHDWSAHETFVGVSLDVGELREAQRMVAERRARLAALEQDLGGGTDSDSISESDSQSDSEEDEKGEAT